jgi:hypothetical protein
LLLAYCLHGSATLIEDGGEACVEFWVELVGGCVLATTNLECSAKWCAL